MKKDNPFAGPTEGISRRAILKSMAFSGVALGLGVAEASASQIQQIDIFHHSHNDVGFTDSPAVCRDLQVRFLDAAVEACRRNPSFYWTIESLMVLEDFRQTLPSARLEALLQLAAQGQLDAMALPFNQAPFQNARQWRQALHWIPEELWRRLHPRVAMQNDVNGFPRAGAMQLLERGVSRLIMGINADSGGPPFRRPTAFWWRMPDGRKIFVWLGDHYGKAYDYLEPKAWPGGGSKIADTLRRPPRAGDFFRTDEKSLRASHAHLLGQLARLEGEGYAYPRLIVSFTNQWRYDNDPPFPPLAPFVDAWNRLGLKPVLRFTTATRAVEEMEALVGKSIPTYEGEWTDWWANGDVSAPREVAASRAAKRFLEACFSPVWQAPAGLVERRAENLLRDLCLFDEHTWGANISISEPWSLNTQSQFAEKALLAFRPMEQAEWLLGRLARTQMAGQPPASFVINAAPAAYTGWVKSLEESPVWVEGLAPHSMVRLEPATPVASVKPDITLDPQGWPQTAKWPGMRTSLFEAGFGDLLAIVVDPPANRSTIAQIHATANPAEREKKRAAILRPLPAQYERASLEENPHTFIFKQVCRHPRMERAERRLEIFRRESRVRLTVRLDRISSVNPELFYISFPLPVPGTLPLFSNGGIPFTPYKDQLPGSCADYYAIDSWAHYPAADGHWLWVSRDAPMVTVGGPHPLSHRTTPPSDPHILHAMVFDNFWHTNFVADSHGTFVFQFELLWSGSPLPVEATAATLISEPRVVVNPAQPESPELAGQLFNP
jgi:hypothetical protein